ncbi:hypothetical protein MMC30_005070 [Trapelia coarctata]|nr:hypothetical protein [Trapelia coarctata]
MPRLPTPLLHRARSISPLLPLLLRTCRDLPSASNELRWLREHVAALPKNTHYSIFSPLRLKVLSTLHKFCLARSRGKPLQYILGSQPFGDVDILCRRGVLIPRPETETYTAHLASLLRSRLPSTRRQGTLRILDLCTGTGCIPLALHALLAPRISALEILGIDISPQALSLSRKNLEYNITNGHLSPKVREQVRFAYGDVLGGQLESSLKGGERGEWDIVISNPPYISPSGFERETERSVRLWEPRLALVPPLPSGDSNSNKGDTFYTALLSLARDVGARILLMEVAGTAQAGRVVDMALSTKDARKRDSDWGGVEVWHDELHTPGESSTERRGLRDGNGKNGSGNGKKDIPVRQVGTGHARAVVCYRGEGGKWLGASGLAV